MTAENKTSTAAPAKSENKGEVKVEAKSVEVKTIDKAPTNGQIKKGDMVRPVHCSTVDAETCIKYPEGTWTEVEKPSDWLDAQFAAGKFERK